MRRSVPVASAYYAGTIRRSVPVASAYYAGTLDCNGQDLYSERCIRLGHFMLARRVIVEKALDVYTEMKQSGLQPDVFSYASLICLRQRLHVCVCGALGSALILLYVDIKAL